MDLKIKDVAELLNVSEATIRRWLSKGKIPAYRLQQQYRFSSIEIENWMQSCRLNPESGGLVPKEEIQIYPKLKHEEKKGGVKQFNLFRAIHRGGVITDVLASDKEGIIREVIEKIAPELSLDVPVLTEMLLDREKLMPTALNNGIAVPHTRDFLQKGMFDQVFVVFLPKPVEWGALDEKPVHTLFFLFASNDKSHLHLLAKLAHLSSQADILQQLRLHKSRKDEVLKAVKQWESTINK